MSKKWDVASQQYRPLDSARVAVVGEELGTQRESLVEGFRKIRESGAFDGVQAAMQQTNEAAASRGAWVSGDYLDQLENQREEIAQLRRYNEDLVQQALAAGAKAIDLSNEVHRLGEGWALLKGENVQLRRDNELLVQLANDAAAAHVAELAKLMASAAQTVVVAPDAVPEFPLRALTHQRQVVGLLTEGYRD